VVEETLSDAADGEADAERSDESVTDTTPLTLAEVLSERLWREDGETLTVRELQAEAVVVKDTPDVALALAVALPLPEADLTALDVRDALGLALDEPLRTLERLAV
jgi:hypothetical protein